MTESPSSHFLFYHKDFLFSLSLFSTYIFIPSSLFFFQLFSVLYLQIDVKKKKGNIWLDPLGWFWFPVCGEYPKDFVNFERSFGFQLYIEINYYALYWDPLSCWGILNRIDLFSRVCFVEMWNIRPS